MEVLFSTTTSRGRRKEERTRESNEGPKTKVKNVAAVRQEGWGSEADGDEYRTHYSVGVWTRHGMGGIGLGGMERRE